MDKIYNIELKEIFNNLIESDNIIITGHQNIDCDCAASGLALYLLLKKYNKNVSIINFSIKPKYTNSIPHIDKIQFLNDENIFDKNILKDAILVILDAGEVPRVGYINKYTDLCKDVYFIDHHKNKMVTKESALKNVNKYYIDEKASATSQIIAQMLLDEKEVDTEIATLLYAGIASDTGGFIYSNTTAETLIVSSKLLDIGCDLNAVVATIRRKYDENDIKAHKYIFDSIIVCEDKRVAYIYSESKIEGTPINQLSISLVETVMQIDGVEIGFVIRKEESSYRISLRSRGLKDIVSIASKYNGGGHPKAAGFEVPLEKYTKENLINEIYNDIKNLY